MLTGLVLALGACAETEPSKANSSGPPPEEPVLQVYNWFDYMEPGVLQQFERETGIKVVYDTFNQNDTLAAQIDKGQYDLMFPSARPWAARFVAEGKLQKLDKSRLEGLGRIDAGVVLGLGEIDPGNHYLVPYLWGTTGLAIDVAAVQSRLGADADLDSWSLVFNPEHAAKLADCGITIVDDMTDVIASALIAAHRPVASASDADLAAAAAALQAIRPYVSVLAADTYVDALAAGKACVVLGYSGDLRRAATQALATDRRVQYRIPKEGAIRWVDVMAIPNSAPHPGNAHQFINYLLRPDVIAGISDQLHYANPNVEAQALQSASLLMDQAVYPNTEQASRLVDAPILPDAPRTQWKAVWVAFKDATATKAKSSD
ncbi:extracellular solute-binding protein [Ahniella affigens]|nr:extracellular solute-binding protein [Ahniella affigens]